MFFYVFRVELFHQINGIIPHKYHRYTNSSVDLAITIAGDGDCKDPGTSPWRLAEARGQDEYLDKHGNGDGDVRVPGRRGWPHKNDVEHLNEIFSEIKQTRFIWILKSLLSENMSWVIPWPIILSIWLRVTWWYESIKVIFHN